MVRINVRLGIIDVRDKDRRLQSLPSDEKHAGARVDPRLRNLMSRAFLLRAKLLEPSAKACTAIQKAPAEWMPRQVDYIGTATPQIFIENCLNLIFATGALASNAVPLLEVFIRWVRALRENFEQFRVADPRAVTHETAVDVRWFLHNLQRIRFAANGSLRLPSQ